MWRFRLLVITAPDAAAAFSLRSMASPSPLLPTAVIPPLPRLLKPRVSVPSWDDPARRPFPRFHFARLVLGSSSILLIASVSLVASRRQKQGARRALQNGTPRGRPSLPAPTPVRPLTTRPPRRLPRAAAPADAPPRLTLKAPPAPVALVPVRIIPVRRPLKTALPPRLIKARAPRAPVPRPPTRSAPVRARAHPRLRVNLPTRKSAAARARVV